MKTALALALLLLLAISRATDALILISPEAAGASPPDHGKWLLWPPSEREGGSNRLLSLLSGIDWAGSGNELIFNVKDGQYLSAGFRDLDRSGYFISRQKIVDVPSIAVASPKGIAPAAALLLAMEGREPQVVPVSLYDPWPPHGIAFAEADGWEGIAAITHKAGGRVLVVEYPPPSGQRWSRFWTRGTGWSGRLPVWKEWSLPGLIPASQAGNLVLSPELFEWRLNDTGNWGGAGQWLAFVANTGPLTMVVLGFLAMFFAGCAVYLISSEEKAKFAGVAVKYLTLSPAAILLSGWVTRFLGFSFATFGLVLALVALTLASQTLGVILRFAFPRAHPMLGIALVGLIATSASPPLWSIYSNVLGPNVLRVSPEAVGAFFAYLVGTCAFSRGSGWGVWIGRSLALLAFLWGISGQAWWVAGQWPLLVLPLAALLIGDKLFRLWMLIPMALLPLADLNVLRHGVAWMPGNLVTNLDQLQSLNLARHVEFLVCYAFLAMVIIGGGIAIFVERYFFHEIRRTILRDSRTKSLFQAGLICASMGVFQPLLLYPALTCFIGCVMVLLSDTARSM